MRRPKLAVPAVALATLLFWSGPAAAATPRLPDLGMAQLRDFQVDRSTGRRLLRFSTEIVNVGSGPFEVRGSRPSTGASRMTATQRLFNTDNTISSASTGAVMVYSGDGHDHWHVENLEAYSIERVGSRRGLAFGEKVGFCFLDSGAYRTSLPGAPAGPRYNDCGSQSSTAVTMGLSVGWGDLYPWYLPYQWIDISGLASGEYIVRAHADPRRLFTESNTANNGTWTRLYITGRDSIYVLEQGPVA